MRQSVLDAFNGFTEPLEGHCSFMYLDVLGLVTTGRGNLIDPSPTAEALPWTHKDGTPATPVEIQGEWQRIKSLQALKVKGGFAFAKVATLWLSNAAIDALCLSKVRAFESDLVKRFPNFGAWPADGQLGLLSMAWAMGTGFRFPKFSVAADASDFRGCVAECVISSVGNPGVVPRNRANRVCFLNAQRVVEGGLDRETLYYPREL